MTPPLAVLALNSGSSSLKFGLYRVEASRQQTLHSGEAGSVEDIAKVLGEKALPPAEAIVHRVVHGGPHLTEHAVIDEAVRQQLEAAAPFAPLHTPATLAVIHDSRSQWPGLPQVACFDTAFHAGLPEVARVLPIARDLQLEGIHRYGFHGLSCESIVHRLECDLPDRLVIAHLGNGSSVTAVKAGRSIDTSMGLTPSGGVMMGTRSGDLDPGLLIYLMRIKKLDAEELEQLVDKRSGLLGVSRFSSDMRRLREAAATNADARLAIEMYCYGVRKQVAAMTAALNGIDMLVFTGGIGEHDAQARDSICNGLDWIGIGPDSIRVLPAQENEQMARHAWRLLQLAPADTAART